MYEMEKDKKYGFENDSQACLTCFLNPVLRTVGRRYRIGMVILPGGSYFEIQEREAEPVAVRYMGYGMQCFILRYSVCGDARYGRALYQLCESIALLRKNCEIWDIDPERIVVCGFSAGGHLAASLGCYGRRLSAWAGYPVIPNALLLGYPVITAGTFAHEPSVHSCLLQKNLMKEEISLERHVTKEMPPVFLWACADDEEVMVQNTLIFSFSLAAESIPFELHIFPSGGHGGSLGDECTARIEGQIDRDYAKWFPLSLSWLQKVV